MAQRQNGPSDDATDEIGSIVHDLRNIFSTIRGFATLVGEELGASDPAREDIDQIQRAVDRGVTVLHRLSAFLAPGSS